MRKNSKKYGLKKKINTKIMNVECIAFENDDAKLSDSTK